MSTTQTRELPWTAIEIERSASVRFAGRLLSSLGFHVAHATHEAARLEVGSTLFHCSGKSCRETQRLSEVVDGAPPDLVLTDTWVMDELELDERELRRRFSDSTIAILQLPEMPKDLRSDLSLSGVLEALGGVLIMRGDAEGRPVPQRSNAIPHAAGILLALGALAALKADERDGERQIVWVNALESVLLLVEGISFGSYQDHGVSPSGKWGEVNYQIGILPAADGYVMAYTPAPIHWQLLCEVLVQRPDLQERPEFATVDDRALHIEELRRELSPWASEHTRLELFRQAQELFIPFGAFLRPDEQMSDPQNVHRKVFVRRAEDPGGAIDLRLPFSWLPARQRRAAPRQPDTASAEAPLAGMRVVDMGIIWAGPLAGRLFRNLGAEVIHIEVPGRFDPTALRTTAGGATTSSAPPPPPTSGTSRMSAGKRSVVLDASKPVGRAALLDLLRQSHMLLINMSARVLPNLDLRPEDLVKQFPQLTVLQMTGYGSEGPYKDYPAYGMSLEAQSGLWAFSVGPQGEPCLVDSSLSDPVAAMFAVTAAIAEQLQIGEPRRGHLDLSERECVLWLIGDKLADLQHSVERAHEQPVQNRVHRTSRWLGAGSHPLRR